MTQPTSNYIKYSEETGLHMFSISFAKVIMLAAKEFKDKPFTMAMVNKLPGVRDVYTIQVPDILRIIRGLEWVTVADRNFTRDQNIVHNLQSRTMWYSFEDYEEMIVQFTKASLLMDAVGPFSSFTFYHYLSKVATMGRTGYRDAFTAINAAYRTPELMSNFSRNGIVLANVGVLAKIAPGQHRQNDNGMRIYIEVTETGKQYVEWMNELSELCKTIQITNVGVRKKRTPVVYTDTLEFQTIKLTTAVEARTPPYVEKLKARGPSPWALLMDVCMA